MQITKKQFIKRKTLWIAGELLKQIVPEGAADNLSNKEVEDQFPKVNYFKGADTGEIRAGLSLKGIRKLVKKSPEITVEQVRMAFGMDAHV